MRRPSLRLRKFKFSYKKLVTGFLVSSVCYLLRKIVKKPVLQYQQPLFTWFLLIALLLLIGLLYPTTSKVEFLRQQKIAKRKHIDSPIEKFASLRINNRFLNPFEEWHDVPFWKTVLFWSRRWKGNGIRSQMELEKNLPILKPDFTKIFVKKSNGEKSPVTFTWFGQSTCLITIGGLTILTDPVFSKCSINDYLGPRRLRPIPCHLEDFQEKIDIVIVSHDHFDHLDERTVHQLGDSVVWYIPLGLKKWFLKRKITNIVELDWWKQAHHIDRPDISITCVPAMHWSGSRTPFEKNNSLWCSFVIKSQNEKIFFCGDTGYHSELFKSIGKLYGPFTLAALPIGSFKPKELMSHLHMGPEDAVKAHSDLGNPRLSVGIHWATFMMSDEHYLAPRRELEQAWESYKTSLFKEENENSTANIRSLEVRECATSSNDINGNNNSNKNKNKNKNISQSMYRRHLCTESRFVTTSLGETIVLD